MNQWRMDNIAIRPDLSHAALSHAKLSASDFRGANLTSANLKGADLRGTYLNGADLNHADLREANLAGADLREANLCEAKLSRADIGAAKLRKTHLNGSDIRGAKFNTSNLEETDLTGVILSETLFINVDLTKALGLDMCKHEGPSTLDHRTLVKSGRLPLSFLRGCGLPEALITYLPSVLNQAVEFYSCFISYSTKDQDFATRLHADLQAKGIRCWFAPHDIRAGKKIIEQIDEAIRIHDRLLLILSKASMSSEWVQTEISQARKREIRVTIT